MSENKDKGDPKLNKQPTKEEKRKEEVKKLSALYIKMESQGIVNKEALFTDRRISYARGKDIEKVFMDNIEEITKEIKNITGKEIKISKEFVLQNVYEE